MNQGIAFARTIRALHADDFRASKLGLLVAVILLGAWVWWLFAARVPQYEMSTDVRLAPGGAIAYFPASAADRIQAGQRAYLRVGDSTFQARVSATAHEAAEGKLGAVLRLLPGPQPSVASPREQRAAAGIEVSRFAPVDIALRSIGRGNRNLNQ
jgi:hypothetical protein